MKKTITVQEFATELTKRINEAKTIECCKDEILNLAQLAAKKIGSEKIEVNWK